MYEMKFMNLYEEKERWNRKTIPRKIKAVLIN
jgi:hypothetical protein